MNRSVLLISAAFLFILCALYSFSYGVANLYSKKSRSQMSVWEAEGLSASESSWEGALKEMHVATYLSPFDADYSFDMGRLYEWDALRREIWTKKAKDSRSMAIKWYRRAIARRPSFGIAWASLAQSKVLNQEIDEETFDALERAMIYGPWEPVLQQKIIWVGLALWDQLPDPVKGQLTVSINRVLRYKHQAQFTIAAAVLLGRTAILRPLLTEKKHIKLMEREIRKRAERKNDAGSL